MYEVEFYKDRKERCFTTVFLNELQTKIRAKVVKWIDKLEKEGAGGFLKKTDRIPEGEVERAERIMQDFLQRSEGG